MFKTSILTLLLLVLSIHLVSAQAAANFDGTDDKATVYHHSDFNLSTHDFTIEAMVRDVALESPMLTIISKRNLASNGFALMINTQDGMQLIAEIGKNRYEVNTSVFEDRRCHSVGLRRSRDEITLFIDDKAYPLGKNTTNINTTENLIIGDDGSNTHQPFEGYIEEVRFWKDARTDGEIFDWNQKCIPSSSSDLLALWNIEENTGQFFHDVASIQHHAYLGSGFSSDNQDPLWASNECLESCCGTKADFNVSLTTPKAYQYVNFTNTSINATSYVWMVNGTVEATTTDFKFGFPIGTHIVRLLAKDRSCQSMQSWVVEVTDFLDNCGAPTNISPCPPDPLLHEKPQMRILDGFGNCYSPEELALPTPMVTRSNVPGYPPGQVCECGIFTLYYQDVINNTDVGFDDPAAPQGTGFTTLGEERRASLCRVFEDLTLLIGANPTASNLGVEDLRITVGASDGTGALALPNNAVAAASSYFFELTSPNIHKFALGEVGRTIIGGRDSYQDWLLYNPVVANDPHGIVQFNFANASFNSDLASITGNHIYVVGLHEVIHALGFRSLIGGTNGPSRFASSNAPNIYAYWDQFIESNQTPVINSTITNNNLSLSFTTNTVNSCGSPNATNGLALDGISAAGNHPVYYNGTYQEGSSFSHFNCTAGVSGYVMNFSGIASITPNPLEVETLCKLGYTISGTFGQNLTASNQSNTLATYNACTPSNCIPIGFTDVQDPNNLGNPFTVNRNGTNNQITIDFSDLLANDFVPAGTTIENLQILQGGGTLSATSSNGNTSFTYSPDLGYGLSWASLSYVPRCPSGELGEIVYVYIWVPAAPYPACDIPTNACNLVCNYDFEAFAPSIFQGIHSQLENYWFSYGNIRALNRSCDLHGYDINNLPGTHPFLCGQIPLPVDFPQKNNYIGIVLNTNTSESFNLKLQPGTTLTPSTTDNYRIGFWVWTCQPQDFDVRVAFLPASPCASQYTDLQDASGYQPPWLNPLYTGTVCASFTNPNDKFNLQIPVSNPTTAGNGNWFYVTQDFHTTVPNLQEFIVHLDQANVANNLYVLFDNFTIESLTTPKINISSTIIGGTCPGATPMIRYTIEGDASIPVNAPLTNVQLDITLPTGIPANLSWATGGDFVNGQHTIPSLAQGDIVTLDLPLNISANALVGSSNQVLIEPTIAGACVSAFSNQSTNIIVTNTASQLAINTSILNSTPTSAQYEISVTNNGPDGIYNIDLEVPTVNGLTFTFNPPLFDLLPGATQTFTLNSTFSITSGCPVLCAEIHAASFACNLPVSGCAPPVSIGSGGNSIDFPIEAENTAHTDPTLFTATAISNNNDVYSVGIFSNDIDFTDGSNTNTLTKNHSCASGFSPFLVKYGACGFEWAVEIPVCNLVDLKVGPDVELGQNGDAYVSFSFIGSFTINGTTYTSQGGSDIAIIKYDATGNPIWVQTAGGNGDDLVTDLETYNNGTNEQVAIIGTLIGSSPNVATFSNTLSVNYNNLGNFCSGCSLPGGITYVASYTDNGTTNTVNWVNSLSNTATFSGKLDIDPTGNIYAIGTTNSGFTFNGLTVGATTTAVNEGAPSFANNDIDLFVLKYNNLGNELWAEVYGSNKFDFGYLEGMGLEFDIECEGSTHLGILLPSAATIASGSQPYMQNYGTHLLRLNANNGSLDWVQPLALPSTTPNTTLTGNTTYRSNLAIDGTNYIVNGSFFLSDPNGVSPSGFASIDFHGTTLSYTSMSAHPAYDRYQGTFTLSFNNTGAIQWVNENSTIVPLSPAIDMHASLAILGVEVDNSGDIYSPFFLRGTTTLGSDNLTGGVNGNQDVVDGFISKIDGNLGNYLRPNVNSPNTNSLNDVTTIGNHQALTTTETITNSNLSTRLYPNPTTGKVTLEIKSDLANNQIEYITIYDVTGRKVQEINTQTSQNSFDINLSSQQAGVYFVEMMINQELITKRIVLMK
ncbi:T9SS type A sorting domain-containing protein [Aureispira sp. CCB-QB1]|uniref:T9SS type A sorting domain-containing protein n=1 Tax=Aureispira sp. CCB-QB1 TaxID=1313421 RepID=UPI00069688FA|nr:T9SS type A sorting domain-containing protein [Aureispira sp. CCB-QB1]